MAKAHKLQTNFTRGELSDRLNGRPDLAAFFNGLTIAENCLIYPQGGIFSRNGTRHVGEVKDSSKRTRGIDFVFNLTDAFFLEFGDQYIRFYKNGRQLTAGNTSYEIAAPYLEAELFAIQYRQANDVMYLWHPGHAPRKLTRVGDTNWTLNTVSFRPPATFEADTDISGGTATLTPGATTGTGVTFTASTAVFLAADSGRQIVTGVGRAIITSYTSPTSVTADIVENFPNTDAIAAGSWLLRNSPQTTLDPSAKEPIGGSTILDAGSAAWRSEDVGKYVKVYGGGSQNHILEQHYQSICGNIEGSRRIYDSKSGRRPARRMDFGGDFLERGQGIPQNGRVPRGAAAPRGHRHTKDYLVGEPVQRL